MWQINLNLKFEFEYQDPHKQRSKRVFTRLLKRVNNLQVNDLQNELIVSLEAILTSCNAHFDILAFPDSIFSAASMGMKHQEDFKKQNKKTTPSPL